MSLRKYPWLQAQLIKGGGGWIWSPKKSLVCFCSLFLPWPSIVYFCRNNLLMLSARAQNKGMSIVADHLTKILACQSTVLTLKEKLKWGGWWRIEIYSYSSFIGPYQCYLLAVVINNSSLQNYPHPDDNTIKPYIVYCGTFSEVFSLFQPIECERDSFLVTLCFALCLLARRALGTASHPQSARWSVCYFS